MLIELHVAVLHPVKLHHLLLHLGSQRFLIFMLLLGYHLLQEFLSSCSSIFLKDLIEIVFLLQTHLRLLDLDIPDLFHIVTLKVEETECFNDIVNLVSFFLLSDSSLLLIDLNDGLAGRHINIHGSSHILQAVALVQNAINDRSPGLF